jgi:hypothetical protein
MVGDLDTIARKIVVPMHAPQVASIWPLWIGIANDCRINRRWVGQLGKGGQNDALFTESGDTVCEGLRVNNSISEAELILEGGSCL